MKVLGWKLRDIVANDFGHYLIVWGWLNSLPIILIGIYSPSANQNAFWKDLLPKKKDIDTSHVVMLRDFNAVSIPVLDRSRKTNSPTILYIMCDFLDQYNMVDSW